MGTRSPSSGADPALTAAIAGALASVDGGPPDVARLLLAAAAVRPASGWEIARAVDAAAPGLLEGREGGLYPLLAAHVHAGRLESRWGTDGAGRPRRAYALPGAPAEDGGPALPVPASAAPARLHRAAREAARDVPGDFERESARAEVLSHLEATAAALARLGVGAEDAARAALREFGDVWKVRTDLGRVHRGRAVVVYARSFPDWVRAFAIYDLVPLLVVVAVLFGVRWKVVQAYNIPTKSMEPTLHGEEDDPDFILVDKTAFLRREPRRWDIVVFYPPREAERRRAGEDPTAFVKRCVGLGGESLNLRGGDLYVDEVLARRPPEIEDAMMVPLYELGPDLRDTARHARLAPIEESFYEFSWKPEPAGAWTVSGGSLDARPGFGETARAAFLKELNNSYMDLDGHLYSQSGVAGDLEVRFVADVPGGGTTVGADLTEGSGDGLERHSVRVGPRGVTLRSGDGAWTSRLARIRPGRPVEVRFRNVDDRLTVWIDGEVVLRVERKPRVSLPSEPAPGGVELVAEGGEARFSGVRILRDIVYIPAGDSFPRTIPPGSFFMMGDNTANSHDSRVWGPVGRDDLIGVPFAVVFPPVRAKLLK
jgi:signal peptidase I